MKRHKPLRRSKKSELKVDPEKVRAWQEGSREAARQRLAKDRREQDRVREAARDRSDRRQVAGERPAKPPRRATMTPRQRIMGAAFHPARPARHFPCVRCGRRRMFLGLPDVRADEWHHWLPQQHIRRYVLTRWRELGIEYAVRLVQRLLADERNLVALCRDCHGEHEHTSRKMSADDVPSSAHEFALELGPEWSETLTRMYPQRPAGEPAARGGST